MNKPALPFGSAGQLLLFAGLQFSLHQLTP
jgi:hypothetical protein